MHRRILLEVISPFVVAFAVFRILEKSVRTEQDTRKGLEASEVEGVSVCGNSR